MGKPGRSGSKRGRIKTGGRKRGSLNRASAARAKVVAAGGQNPLNFLLAEMRAPMPPEMKALVDAPKRYLDNPKLYVRLLQELNIWHARRFEAAKAAAPYVHPRLSAHKVEGPGEDGEHVWDVRVSFVE